MTLKLYGSGSIENVDSIVTSASATLSATELGYIDGVTSAIQTQLNNAGKILQVVRATDSTLRSTTSTSLVDATGMTVTITPQKSSSAILLILSALSQTAGNTYHYMAITDNSNNILSNRYAGFSSGTTGIVGVNYPITMIAYDTPATTSATTYKIRHATGNGSISAKFNNTLTAEFYALEISA